MCRDEPNVPEGKRDKRWLFVLVSNTSLGVRRWSYPHTNITRQERRVGKSAFVLVGLGAYLVLILPLPTAQLTLISLCLAGILVAINIVGVKQSGYLQVLVSFVLLVLFAFSAEGAIQIRPGQFQPFFEKGVGGLLAVTGFVFVSYAGLTKIASIAGEVERPDRNLPLGILVSVGGMVPVYVVVGVTPPDLLHSSLTPMADATEQLQCDQRPVPNAGALHPRDRRTAV